MAITAFPLDAVSGAPEYTGRMLRNTLAALLGPAPAGRPLGAVSGVRPGTPTTVVSISGMTCRVDPHAGVLDVQAAATAGPYLYAITAQETAAIPAAHATYTRWDRVSIQLSDPAEGDGSSTPAASVIYTAGTPSASPALPAAPARSITLARITVPQSGGGSPSVTWLAPEWTQPASAALDSLFVAGTPAANPTVYRNHLGEVSIDGGWLMAAGTSPVTPAIAYNTGTTILTLPAGFRPSKALVFPSGAYGAVAQIVANVRVDPSGNVSVFANNGGSGTTTAVFALTGVRFQAAL